MKRWLFAEVDDKVNCFYHACYLRAYKIRISVSHSLT
jgi:hypothetical protein